MYVYNFLANYSLIVRMHKYCQRNFRHFIAFFVLIYLIQVEKNEVEGYVSSITSMLKVDKFSILNEIMMELVKLCYSDSKYIIIYSDHNSDLEKNLQNFLPITVSLQKNVSETPPAILRKNPIDLIIIDVNTTAPLQTLLTSYRKLSEWNVLIPVFLLNKSINGTCDAVHDVFNSTWKINILSSYFICTDTSDRKIMIYTYNPYTNYAPKCWKKIDTSGYNRTWNGWTLYRQPYNSATICHHLNWDRQRFLNGSIINIGTSLIDKQIYTDNSQPIYNESCITHLEYPSLINGIKYALNVTLVFNYNFLLYENHMDIYERLKNSTTDLVIFLHHPHPSNDYSATHPIDYIEYYIFTHFQGKFTMRDRVWKFEFFLHILMTIIIMLITFSVIFFLEKRYTVIFMAFEVFKLIINTQSNIKISVKILKIFFSLAFLYFICFNIHFYAHIISHFTYPGLKYDAEAIQDLENSCYTTVYADTIMYPHFSNSLLKNKAVLGTPYCVEHIKTSKSVACIDRRGTLFDLAVEKNLHVSRNSVSGSFRFYLMRNNWPLRERINKLLMWIQQAGLSKRWSQLIKLKNETRGHANTARELSKKFQSTGLGRLKYVFILLIAGLSFSIICFVCEKFI